MLNVIAHIQYMARHVDHNLITVGVLNTILVGDDTDQLILHCSKPHDFSIMIISKYRTKDKYPKSHQIFCGDIKFVKSSLDTDMFDNNLLTHSILECDATSRLFDNNLLTHSILECLALAKL